MAGVQQVIAAVGKDHGFALALPAPALYEEFRAVVESAHRFQCSSRYNGGLTVTAIHPGEHLAEELKELGMSAAELARNLDVPTNRITGILNGQRGITGDTALRLAHFFGTSAEFWLNLQSLYELRIAQKKVGRSIEALPRLTHGERVPA